MDGWASAFAYMALPHLNDRRKQLHCPKSRFEQHGLSDLRQYMGIEYDHREYLAVALSASAYTLSLGLALDYKGL